VPSCVDNVVNSGHHMEVASFVDEASVSKSVIPWRVSEIALEEGLVTSPESHDARRRKRQLEADLAESVWWKFFIGVLINDSDVSARNGFACRAR